ncbi:hypothetical protein ACX0G7_12620 [Flavitalea antarctica]
MKKNWIILLLIFVFIRAHACLAQEYYSPTALEAALTAKDLRWKNDSGIGKEYFFPSLNIDALEAGKALYYLAFTSYLYRARPTENFPVQAVHNRIIQQLRVLLAGGNEPSCRGTIAGWADNPLAQALVLIKYNSTLWNKLKIKEREQLSFLMKCLVVAGNYCQNFYNQISTDLYQTYDWRKTWNPNHQEGYVGIMIAGFHFFGGKDAVDNILKDFSFDKYMAQLKKYRFKNIIDAWTAAGKALLENGGKDAGGGVTKGVKMPFTYQSLVNGTQLPYHPTRLYKDLHQKMYVHVVTDSSLSRKAYTINASSPYKGQQGMCYEFQTTDAFGERSAAMYCYEGWWNNVITRTTLELLGKVDRTIISREMDNRMMVGSNDLIFKLENGYQSLANGKLMVQKISEANKGYACVKHIWKDWLETKLVSGN